MSFRPIFSLLACLLSVLSLSAQDFYGKTIQEVRLHIPSKRWDYQLDSIKSINPEARLLGSVTINGMRFDSIGVRYKGNSSYFRTRKQTYKKLPFNIKLDYKIKTQKLPGGQTSVKLSNAFLDPGFIRDPLSYHLIKSYMPAPVCNFTRLYVNGTYYGVYINTESVDSKFIRKHFEAEGGQLVKCDPDNWRRTKSQSGCPKGENASLVYLNDQPGCYDAFYEADDPAAWKLLINLTKTLNKKTKEVETVLNVDQALWMLALNNIMVNLDSYNGSLSHNYYLWFDSSGVAHPIIWDLNMSLGGWRRNMSFEEMKDDELIRYSPMAEIDNLKRPLISKLLQNSHYRRLYLAHYRTILNEQFKNDAWLKTAQEMTREIDPWVKKDSLKLYSYEDFLNAYDKTMVSGPDKVIGMRQLMAPRTEWLSKHPLLTKAPPTISEVKHSAGNDTYTVTAKTNGGEEAWLYYRAYKSRAFQRIVMESDGAGNFTATIPKAEARHYYVAVFNPDAAATYPERASHESLKF